MDSDPPPLPNDDDYDEIDDNGDDDMVPSDSEELTIRSESEPPGRPSSSSASSSIKNKSGPYVLPVKPISNKVGSVALNVFTDRNNATTLKSSDHQDVSSINLNLDALTSGLTIKEPPQLLSGVKMTTEAVVKSKLTIDDHTVHDTTHESTTTAGDVATNAIANVSDLT